MKANSIQIWALSAALVASACSSNLEPGPSQATAPVVAEVNGAPITLDEIDQRIAGDLYEVRSQALQERIIEIVLETAAARQGVTEEELIEAKARELGPVSDEDVAAFFEQNRARMRPDETLESVGPEIRSFLEQNQQRAAVDALRDAATVAILLDPPRLEVADDGPSRGPADAAVTIIEFSDYQCPFCSRAEPIIAEVLELYPEDVRLVFRHFPIDSIHPRARPASIAAVCAEEQGKFWEFHEMVFENQQNLSDQAIGGFADTLQLDRAAFDSCLASEEAAARVEADLAAGKAAGTSGTPAFFVNGILLSGARPVPDFVDLIDAELDRLEGGS
jgi:protein-disulfide isomerase